MNEDIKEDEKTKEYPIWTLPNIMTLGRMALLPFIIACMYGGFPWAALTLYTIACFTDFLDGYLARRMNAVTPFGTFLDPISDKVFVAAILIVLVDLGPLALLGIIPVLIILTREFLISGLREFLGPKNIKMPVTNLAKWKTTAQMVSLGFLIAAPANIVFLITGWLFITIAAGLTAYTGYVYMRAAWPHMK